MPLKPRTQWPVWTRLPGAVWCGLVGVLLYAHTVGFGLVNYDDPWLVASNTPLSNPTASGLAEVWFDLSTPTRLRLGAEYLPVRDLSTMVDRALFGNWYGGHHLTNVLLYGLLCGLACLCFGRWTSDRGLALIAGLLYAVHPLHVESVAWLSERKGLLAGVLVLAATLLFRRFCAAPSLWRWAWAVLPALLAVWSKAPAVAGIGLWAVLLRLYPPRSAATERDPNARSRRLAWLGWAAALPLILAAFWPVWSVAQRLVVEAPRGISTAETLWTSARVTGLYLTHLFLAGPLGIAYPLPDNLAYGLAGLLAGGGLLGLTVVGLWRRGEWSIWALGAALFVLFFAPASQLFAPLQNLVADRYMLLPSLGFVLLAAAAIRKIRLLGLRAAAVGVLCLTGGLLTVLQTLTWSSAEALYHQALAVNSRNTHAMLQLSALARAAGHRRLAGGWVTKAAAVAPTDPKVVLHLGLQHQAEGRTSVAIELWSRHARRYPGAHKLEANLAHLMLRRGRVPEALDWAQRAARSQPLAVHNQRTLGLTALQAGQLKQAQVAFERARALEPHNAVNVYNCGLTAARQGQSRRAVALLQHALELNPTLKPAQDLLTQIKKNGIRSNR